ncbi:MAG: dihydroneopterin aldolase [Nitrospiria bacterium]
MIVSIKNLRLRGIVGVYDWEKKIRQEISINLRLTFDGDKAAKTDDINETIDYKKLRNQIIAHVENTDFNLVEKVANDTADIALSFSLAQKVWVEVEKPGALRLTDTVSIIVEKEKGAP